MLKQDRLNQIKFALGRIERPSTYGEVAKIVGITKSQVGRLIGGNAELFTLWSDNKKYHRQRVIDSKIKLINDTAKECGISVVEACVKLGHGRDYHYRLKASR